MRVGEEKPAATVIYENVVIGYIQSENKWVFELRGRERKAESLTQAKEWIDKPEPDAKKKKAFERFEVYLFKPSSWDCNKPEIVTLTSAAEPSQYGHGEITQAWIMKRNGERSKEDLRSLFIIAPSNVERLAQYEKLSSQISALTETRKLVYESLEKVTLNV